MPRPERFNEKTRRRRLFKRRQQAARDEALSSGEGRRLPFEQKPGDHALLFETYLRIIPNNDLVRELAWLLVNTEAEWQRQRGIVEVRPTPGEMNAIVEDGAKLARKLREWSHTLPAALFHNVPVLIPGDPPLRATIEHLAHTFELLTEIYRKGRGRPPGNRDLAQSVAVPLMLFAYRHAPEATRRQRRVFVRECLHLVEIKCPDPEDHPTDCARWFRSVETAASRGIALSLARSRARAAAQSQLSE